MWLEEGAGGVNLGGGGGAAGGFLFGALEEKG